MDNLVYLVPLFPLLGFLINGLFRKSLSKGAIGIIGSGSILLSFILSVILFVQVKSDGGSVSTLFDFINVADFRIPFAFQVDQLSVIFLLIITGVGFLIHLYSTAYMHDEPAEHFGRYFCYLNLFSVFPAHRHVVPLGQSTLCGKNNVLTRTDHYRFFWHNNVFIIRYDKSYLHTHAR